MTLVALIRDEPPTTDESPGVGTWLARMCRAATRALPASGVGVSLMAAADIQMTVSIGIAVSLAGSSGYPARQLLAAADGAMYQAKRSGPGQTVIRCPS